MKEQIKFDIEAAVQALREGNAIVTIIGYFDLDPAGLGMVIDYGVDAILIPYPLNVQLANDENNKPDSHASQLTQRPDLAKKIPKSCCNIWEWITKENRKCAITQERITTIGWSLRRACK